MGTMERTHRQGASTLWAFACIVVGGERRRAGLMEFLPWGVVGTEWYQWVCEFLWYNSCITEIVEGICKGHKSCINSKWQEQELFIPMWLGFMYKAGENWWDLGTLWYDQWSWTTLHPFTSSSPRTALSCFLSDFYFFFTTLEIFIYFCQVGTFPSGRSTYSYVHLFSSDFNSFFPL